MSQNLYGFPQPLTQVFPAPIIAQRAPLTSDLSYPIGQMWVDEVGNDAYVLVDVTAASATWQLAAATPGEIATLTGDSGGAIAPVGGDVVIAGGTNITTVGTPGTITANLDAAISLATSVTSPIYTTSAADMNINAAAAKDVIVKMGDAAGAHKVLFKDSSSTQVASIDSLGNVLAVGNIEMTASAKQLQIKGGAATDFIGSTTLVGGTKTIANTNIAAGDRIFLQRITPNASTAIGSLKYSISAATSFTITSVQPAAPGVTEANDVSDVAYVIVRQL